MRRSHHVILKRHQDIVSMLSERGKMLVNELSDALDVSEITIRRDLECLAESGAVERFHGGGMLPRAATHTVPYFEEKSHIFIREKTLIATVVADLVEPNTTVSLNAGTTTLEIIRRLKEKPVRIITNNAMASMVLQESVAELICVGGEYNGLTRAFTGDLASIALGRMYADTCVLGANGVSATAGVTSSVYTETFLNELMVNRCRGRCIIAADGSKIGKIHCFGSVTLDRVHTLVTDASANPEALEAIRALGVRVVIAREEGAPSAG